MRIINMTKQDKVHLRQVTHSYRNAAGKVHSYRVWRATFKGHTAEAVCPVWAYCEVREKARRGW